MITVKVTYTVSAAFAAKNQQNILTFLEDFRDLNADDFRYTVYLGADGKTFIHISQYRTESIQKELLNVPSFKSFQKQRDESGLEAEPQIEVMKLLDWAGDFVIKPMS
ncbi:MAG TPA: hypothetical protein VK644_01680 [Chitinophagaceae bacterium]|nr:hypothetical protein [Chitinophagaceae bacterium]